METIIRLPERINTENGNQVEKDIYMQITKDTDCIILDAENLKYISSVGLRIILILKKSYLKISIINCDPNVYEIFSISGFTQMMVIEKAFRKISIEGCKLIGTGFFGNVYKLDDETIVKVYKYPGLDMIKTEQQLAKKAFVRGIPTAIPYDIVKVGDSYGMVFELLNAATIVDHINDDNSVIEFCQKSVDVLKKIHSTHVEPGQFPSRVDQYIKQIEGCKDCFSDEVYRKLLILFKNLPNVDTLVHSDFHIKNIMMQNDELLLIDMDKLSTGQPIFEFGALYATYIAFALVDQNNTMEFLGIPRDKSKKIFDTTFELYFMDKTEEEKAEIHKKAEVIAHIIVLYIRKKFGDDKDEMRNKVIAYSIEQINKLVNQIDILE